MSIVRRPDHGAHFRPSSILTLCLFALISLAIAGCASTSIPQVGPIQFVDFDGKAVSAVSTLPVNGHIYLVADVTSDNQLLGASWTVTCGNPTTPGVINTSCGVCNPAQTASGPIPQYPSTGIITTYTAPSVIPTGAKVTITAHATSLPSVTTSVTLTIIH